MNGSARIGDLLWQGRCFSFEFFPPRTDAAEAQLKATLVELEPLHPSFGARATKESFAMLDLPLAQTTPRSAA